MATVFRIPAVLSAGSVSDLGIAEAGRRRTGDGDCVMPAPGGRSELWAAIEGRAVDTLIGVVIG